MSTSLILQQVGQFDRIQSMTIATIDDQSGGITLQQPAFFTNETARCIYLSPDSVQRMVEEWATQQGLMLVPRAGWPDVAIEGPAWPARNEAQI